MRTKLKKQMLFLQERGFTLLESMIALIVVGLIVSSIASALTIYQTEQKSIIMDNKYDAVRSKINRFILEDIDPSATITQLRARYPCPAPLNAGPKDANYGIEQRDPATGECLSTNDGSNGIFDAGGSAYIGAVPARSLGLTASHMLDAYGYKLTYAISQNLVLDNALNTGFEGQISIQDETGAIVITNAPFALISHGMDGAGAYSIEGDIVNSCRDLATADGENCDHLVSGAPDATFRESRVKIGDSTEFYDDRLSFSLVDEDDDEWWAPFPDSPDDLRNKNPGIICIGASCDFSDAETNDALLVDGDIQGQGAIRASSGFISGNVSDPANIHDLGTGSIVAGDGGIPVPTEAGMIVAENDVAAQRDLLAGQDVVATRGVIVGPVTNPENIASGSIAVGNINANATRAGQIRAEKDIYSENGKIQALNGGIIAKHNVEAQGSVEAGENVYAKEGFIAAHTDIISHKGNLEIREGSITAEKGITSNVGDIWSGNNVEAFNNLIATQNVEAKNGDVTAGNNVIAMNMAQAASYYYSDSSIVGSSGGTGNGSGGEVSLGDFGCPPGRVFVRMVDGTPVCKLESELDAGINLNCAPGDGLVVNDLGEFECLPGNRDCFMECIRETMVFGQYCARRSGLDYGNACHILSSNMDSDDGFIALSVYIMNSMTTEGFVANIDSLNSKCMAPLSTRPGYMGFNCCRVNCNGEGGSGGTITTVASPLPSCNVGDTLIVDSDGTWICNSPPEPEEYSECNSTICTHPVGVLVTRSDGSQCINPPRDGARCGPPQPPPCRDHVCGQPELTVIEVSGEMCINPRRESGDCR